MIIDAMVHFDKDEKITVRATAHKTDSNETYISIGIGYDITLIMTPMQALEFCSNVKQAINSLPRGAQRRMINEFTEQEIKNINTLRDNAKSSNGRIIKMYRAFEGDARVIIEYPNGTQHKYTVSGEHAERK